MKPGQIVYQGKTKKGRDILIRYPTSSDVEALLNYFNTLSKEKTFIRFQGEQMTLEEETKYLNEQLPKIANNKSVILLGIINNQLIGVSDIKMLDKIEKHIGIFGLTVAREYRCEGIGKLLMKLVLEEAQKNLHNLKIVTLGLFAGNNQAHELYKKFGFVEFGRIPKGIIYKENYIDHILMYKEI